MKSGLNAPNVMALKDAMTVNICCGSLFTRAKVVTLCLGVVSSGAAVANIPNAKNLFLNS